MLPILYNISSQYYTICIQTSLVRHKSRHTSINQHNEVDHIIYYK